jgi:two-component system, LytTR family, response regulator
MIRVVLIDDESLARRLVRKYLEDFSEFEIVDECADGFTAAKSIAQHKPDLIFLDVQMPKLNGFELIELLDPCPCVIFTTAFDQYALKAFEASAVDYLLKPFGKDRFDKAIQNFKDRFSQSIAQPLTKSLIEELHNNSSEIDRIAVKSGNEIRILSTDNLRFLEAHDDYVKLFSKTDLFLKKQTLSYYDAHLPERQFVRIHRSFIVNIEEILRIEQAEKDGHWIILKDLNRLPVSRSGYQKLKKVLGI